MILNAYISLFILTCLTFDMSEGRIPNLLILIFIVPLLVRAVCFGLPEGFLNLSLPVLIMQFAVWYLGFLGGADVKVFIALSLILTGSMLLKVLCLTLALSLLVFLARSACCRRWVRDMPMMPFVAVSCLVLWL